MVAGKMYLQLKHWEWFFKKKVKKKSTKNKKRKDRKLCNFLPYKHNF